MPVGYMRVSSDWGQTTELKRDPLLWAGVGSWHRTTLAAGDTSVGSTPTCVISLPDPVYGHAFRHFP